MQQSVISATQQHSAGAPLINITKPKMAEASDAMCATCQVKPVATAGATCSRRCGWMASCCCPQCGRTRAAYNVFCSTQCGNEARQANWCTVCGTRQVSHGYASCGLCAATTPASGTPMTPAAATPPTLESTYPPALDATYPHGGASSMGFGSMHSALTSSGSFYECASTGSGAYGHPTTPHHHHMPGPAAADPSAAAYGYSTQPHHATYPPQSAAATYPPMAPPSMYFGGAPISGPPVPPASHLSGAKVIAPAGTAAPIPTPAAAPPQSGRGSNGNRRDGASSGGRGGSNASNAAPHEILAPGHKAVGPIISCLGDHVDAVASVVKVGGPSAVRKRYLAYRARIEDELTRVCGTGAPKFGHGGEGNEQRRFVPLQVECLNAAYNSTAPCASATCQYCALLRNGAATLAGMGQESHFSVATMKEAMRHAVKANEDNAAYAGGNAAPLVAVAVCRVVVGNPMLIESVATLDVPQADHHSTVIPAATPAAPSHKASHHSNGGGFVPAATSAVGAAAECYVFDDDALDVLHVVLADAAAAASI